MSFTREQYDAVMREYSYIQQKNQRAADLRTREIYEKYPELKEMNSRLISARLAGVSAFYGGSADKETESAGNREALRKERDAFLKKHGLKEADFKIGFDCGSCMDTGFTQDGACTCFKQKMIRLMYRDSNLKNMARGENFGALSMRYYSDEELPSGGTQLEQMEKVIDYAKKFCEGFGKGDSESLMFRGKPGTGKTFISNCIANALIEKGFSVIYFTAPELFELFNDIEFGRSDQRKNDYIEECDLLIIDDLGAEVTTRYANSDLFRILNGRLVSRKSTIISTNYGPKDIEEVYGERIFSRILGNYTVIGFKGDDLRQVIKQERKADRDE